MIISTADCGSTASALQQTFAGRMQQQAAELQSGGTAGSIMTGMLQSLDAGLRAATHAGNRQQLVRQPALSAGDIVAEYNASLQRCACDEVAAYSASSRAVVSAVWQELTAWWDARQSARGIPVTTMSPVDIKVFFESC